MKANLSFKILAVLTILFILLFGSLAYVSYVSQKNNLTEAFIERAKSTVNSLQVTIESRQDIEDKNKILLSIQKNMLLDPEIQGINFSLPKDGMLRVYVSSNPSQIDKEPGDENQKSFNLDALTSSIVTVNSIELLKVNAPVHISGGVVGTIQIDFTLENVNRIIRSSIYSLLALYVLMMLLFLTLIYLALRYIIVRPLLEINVGLAAIAENNLDYHPKISSDDEIGVLAKSFEKMAGIVSATREELRTKVVTQTKEIEEKAVELEHEKSAILNILEDVQKKEERAELLAGDLAKFKLAVENASDMVIITDIECTVVYGNKAVETITGYGFEEFVGKKAGTLWKMPMPDGYYENMWDVIKKQKKVFLSEIQNRRKDGRIFIAQISISPVLDKNNDIIYFVSIEHDITKEKEIDRAKTEFVSLASHQLRTPLSSINWYTEMLLAGDAGAINEEQKKYLTEVSVGNQRMVDLVNALLNVSRLDLGTFIVEPEKVDVVDLVNSVIGELQPEILHRKLKVKTSFEEHLPEFLADKKLLRMIIQNLLSNAVKYTDEKGDIVARVSLVSSGAEFGGRSVSVDSLGFMVSDTGIGIPDEQKGKIFSKMFRADNAREAETEGTGLGLYIIKSVVDQSGGAVWFESEIKKGTTFYVTFPLTGMKKKEGTKNLD